MAEKKSADLVAQMRDRLETEATLVPQDGKDVAQKIASNVLSAETVSDVFAAAEGSLTHSDALLDQPVTITDVRFNQSGYSEQVAGFYAVIDYVDDNGVPGSASIGSNTAMTQLYKLYEMGAFPMKMVLRQKDRPTAAGYFPQFWQPAK